MKSILLVFFSWLSINSSYSQKQKILLKERRPLVRGYFEFQSAPDGVYISKLNFIALFSDCDSVFSIKSGIIAAASESSKDTIQKLIVKSGDLSFLYFGLKQLNVKKGDKIAAGQFIGLAKKISPEKYSITLQIGDKKDRVWGRQKQENYLEKSQ